MNRDLIPLCVLVILAMMFFATRSCENKFVGTPQDQQIEIYTTCKEICESQGAETMDVYIANSKDCLCMIPYSVSEIYEIDAGN